jgi:general secretion pathway protein A
MYESYWQFECNPFENNADVGFFYQSETHQAALLKLRYVIENRKGAALLVGGVGSGKSFLVNALAQQLGENQGPFVQIVFPQMSAAELLAYLAVELGAEESAVGSEAGGMDRTIRQIQQLLLQYSLRARHPVIVIDEAHLIEDPHVFQALRLLLNFQQQNGVSFTLILSGQRDLLSRVHRMPQLEERIGVKCLLRPLSYDETLAYITHRLQVAGSQQAMFEPQALDAIFELSGGIPRKINRLCDLALLVGYADGSASLSAEQLEAVSEELTAVGSD